MKYLKGFFPALSLVLLLTGCVGSPAPGSDGPSQPAASQTPGDCLTRPPALTVWIGEDSAEALLGTYSWDYDAGGGTWAGVESDSAHPLDAEAWMPHLQVLPETSSADDPPAAVLEFEVEPDEVQVCCWSDAHWGNTAAESETAPLHGNSVMLKDSGYIYEVIAAWNSGDHYHGTAHYSFYVTLAQPREAPLTVASGGETVIPYLHFAWSAEWTGEGFLAADGLYLDAELPRLAAEGLLPELLAANDLAITYGEHVRLSRVQLFDENFARLADPANPNALADLESGKYCVAVVINEQGEYVEEADAYENTGWACVFMLIVP